MPQEQTLQGLSLSQWAYVQPLNLASEHESISLSADDKEQQKQTFRLVLSNDLHGVAGALEHGRRLFMCGFTQVDAIHLTDTNTTSPAHDNHRSQPTSQSNVFTMSSVVSALHTGQTDTRLTTSFLERNFTYARWIPETLSKKAFRCANLLNKQHN